MNRPEWLEKLTEDVRIACKAFNQDNYPDAWLYLGCAPDNNAEKDWYDWNEPLLGLPVYHSPANLTHAGYDGEHQVIIPLWFGDVSDKNLLMKEFQCRLAKSGDY